MDDYFDVSLNYTKTSSLNSSLASLIFAVPTVLLIIFGGYMVIDGNLSLGSFTAFISYVSLFFSPISQLSTLWTSYKSAIPAFDRVKELFDMESDDNGSNELKITNGEIKLENVSFSYDNRPIINDFNATLCQRLKLYCG